MIALPKAALAALTLAVASLGAVAANAAEARALAAAPAESPADTGSDAGDGPVANWSGLSVGWDIRAEAISLFKHYTIGGQGAWYSGQGAGGGASLSLHFRPPAALSSGVLAIASILIWLWTGTAEIPEKPEKDVGLGLTLPIYVSGPSSVGWWGMLITMMGILTAFLSLVFGYFFYWTARPDFPPDPIGGPGVRWPVFALVLLAAAWLCTVMARRWNRIDARVWFYAALAAAALLAAGGGAALTAGPWLTGLDPQRHVYGAIVWILVIWSAAHVGVGIIMHAYCAARRLAGRMTAQHDQDIVNVALYWHFVAFTVCTTVVLIAGFPLLT